MKKPCDFCLKIVNIKPVYIRTRKNTFCSSACYGLWKKRWFKEHPEMREKIRLWALGRKQSKETIQKRLLKVTGQKRTLEQRRKMSHAAKKGPDNVGWRGGKCSENYKLRRGSNYKMWRDSVFQRDNYTCQECGERGGELNAHHVKSWAEHPHLRYEISNGITLCIICHKETDSYLNNKINQVHSLLRVERAKSRQTAA